MAEKKGLIYKFIVGKDKDENYARSTLPSNRWELFWDILKGRFWKLVLLNLMLIIAFVPTAFIYLLKFSNITALGSIIPFSGSLYVGSYIPYLYDYAITQEFMINWQTYMLLIPALMFAGVIMSGVFYIARNLVWSEGVFIANDFWKGLKSNILFFLGITFIAGLLLFMANLNISVLDRASYFTPGQFMAKPFVNNLLKGLTYVFMVFFMIMVFFSFTITVTYKVKFRHLIKNSFILTLGLLPRNIFFLALALAPFLIIYLFPGGMLTGLLMGVVLMLGFSCAVIIWSVYSHWVFDTFINDKVEGALKNKGLYQKMNKEGKPVNKKSWFDNPKKKRAVKPVTDEEVKITELPTNFSRADLAKLAAEKEAVKLDSEKWAEEHANDFEDEEMPEEDDSSVYENYEDAMKLDGYEEGMEDDTEDKKDE